jgi:hypothetical protein
MRIISKEEGSSSTCDRDEAAKNRIASFIPGHSNLSELDSVLSEWIWEWETLASDFIKMNLWVDVLNKLDECLRFIITEFGDLLLVTMVDLQATAPITADELERERQGVESLQLAKTILSWTGEFLNRAIEKDVYNSIEVCTLRKYFVCIVTITATYPTEPTLNITHSDMFYRIPYHILHNLYCSCLREYSTHCCHQTSYFRSITLLPLI